MRLIDADALVKCVNKIFGLKPDARWSHGAVLNTIDAAPTIGEWIRVEDRLPQATEPDVKGNIVFSERVFVYEVYEDGFTYTNVSRYNVAMGSWLSEVPSFGCKVTHWMPIPEPPEEVAKAE